MKVVFQCDICGKDFVSCRECRVHEYNHFAGIDALKYKIIYMQEEDICDYCKHSYYVYGCEHDCDYNDECKYKNNYKDFAPVEPLGNKRLDK